MLQRDPGPGLLEGTANIERQSDATSKVAHDVPCTNNAGGTVEQAVRGSLVPLTRP